MRLRSVLLLSLGVLGAILLLRLRKPSEYVDVHFDDGATVRLSSGREARDLLDDADAVLDAVT